MSGSVEVETKSQIRALSDGEEFSLVGVFRNMMHPGKAGTFDTNSAIQVALSDGKLAFIHLDSDHEVIGGDELQVGSNVRVHARTEVMRDAYETGSNHKLLLASSTTILPAR